MTEADLERLMQDYRDTVRGLFDKESPDVVGNASPRHAAVLIEEMVLHAKKTFVAFAEMMSTAVWTPAVMAALADAVARGVDVRLLVENSCEPILNGTMPESVRKHVRKLGDLAELRNVELAHCAAGDRMSLRFETDRAKKTAVFSAHRPELASKIEDIFNSLFGMGVAYDAA